MLTDRQQKIYADITRLSSYDKISSKEKKYLLRTKSQIEEGVRFQDTVNALSLSLTAWEERERKSLKDFKGLDPEVRQLLDSLEDIYGKPDYRSFNTLKDTIMISGNPNIVAASPAHSEDTKKSRRRWGILKAIMYLIIGSLLIYFIIYVLFV